MPGWWQEVVGLVLPAVCAGCGAVRGVLCEACREALTGADLGPGRGPGGRRVRPRPVPGGLPPVYAAAPYEGVVRAVLLAHKERGALPLAEPLGAALAGAVRAGPLPGGPVVLVPVPSAPARVRARGHDPVRRIALAAAARLRREGTAVRVAAVLGQRRPVADQAGLGARERRRNLAGALYVRPGGAGLLAGARTVLVDDLVTTGATLAEAARAVRAQAPAAAGPDLLAAVVAGPSDAFESRSEKTRTAPWGCE
ncbi:ComF family protein [Streptomyces sp. WAC06614]|uniref:ComF family protein n=1 Tax=Streptomyces sp. WAC06614 TaxID=2487416 RepID=UPI000F7A0DC2|nr:phosphoribosyltransferase family protein [Streptomyces sp. WAC06614]RSS78116.1 ComF family protein [Streptomyces sp. WAC06614]